MTIFSIIFVVFTLGYFVLMGVQRTVLRPQFYKNVVVSLDLEKVIHDKLNDEFSKYDGEQEDEITEVLTDTIKEVVNEKTINDFAFNLIDDMFEAINDFENKHIIEINLEDIKVEFTETFKSNARKYLDENSTEVVSDSELDDFVNAFIDEGFPKEPITINLKEVFEDEEVVDAISKYNTYRPYILYGPYVIFFFLSLIIILIGGFKRGMRWISTDMLIPSILFIIALLGGLFFIKPLVIIAAKDAEFIKSGMIDSIFNNAIMSFGLVPIIFLVVSIIIKIIFRKPKKEPVIIDSGNIVNQAQL